MFCNFKRLIQNGLCIAGLLFSVQPLAAQIRIPGDTSIKNTFQLNEFKVLGKRNTRLDSLFYRKEYAQVFNHKGPGIKDLFSQKVTTSNLYSAFQPSTSSIAGVNLLAIPGFLNRKSNVTHKLKQKLLDQEETQFIDRAFSKQLIMALTNLKGDSLALFCDRYRPSFAFAKETTEYEMIRYIKKCMAQFVGNGRK